MKTRNPKLFRWALWWGLGITVACLVALVVNSIATMDDTTGGELNAQVMDSLYSIIYNHGIWPMIIFIGVIAPVYEELVFRLWGNGKRWTGYTSVVLMALFSLTIAWWVAPIALAAGIAIMVGYRTDLTRRLFALMLFSSLLFALMHIGNYSTDQNLPMFIVAVLHKFGMGLLASYLVINYNILWSIGFHILNNGVMAILLGMAFNSVATKTTVIEENENYRTNYRITMTPALTKSQASELCGESGWVNDSVFVKTDSPDFAAEMFINNPNHNDSGFKAVSGMKFYPKMNIKVEMLGGSRDYASVINTMAKEGWIALDTVGDTISIRNTYSPIDRL